MEPVKDIVKCAAFDLLERECMDSIKRICIAVKNRKTPLLDDMDKVSCCVAACFLGSGVVTEADLNA